ncbi:MAG: hypothetical protein KDD66_03150 [Bdellovibrionales bacterium]|nr:hypothetical protein [Bdellovibrionales bacterium]
MAGGVVPSRQKYPPVSEAHAKSLGLSEDEWGKILQGVGREPNEYECLIFAILWSEKCSNKSSSLMLQTAYRQGHHVIRIPWTLAGVVDIGLDEAIAISFEHNNNYVVHDPYLGAQSALANVTQRLNTVGAKPIAYLNFIRLGPMERSENQLHLRQTLAGLSDYSNRIGIPIVGGDLGFHPRYEGTELIGSVGIGFVPNEEILKPAQAELGSPVLCVGAKTDYAGLMMEHQVKTEKGEKTVEKKFHLKFSDPYFSHELGELVREAGRRGLVNFVTAIGDGGLCKAPFDLANAVTSGVRIDLDRVPCVIEEPNPNQILLSETGDRYMMLATKDRYRELTDLFSEAGYRTQQIGELVDTDDVEFHWRHQAIAVIPYAFAAGETIEKHFDLVKFPPMLKNRSFDDEEDDTPDSLNRPRRDEKDDWSKLLGATEARNKKVTRRDRDVAGVLEDVWIDLLADPNLCSRGSIIKTFDQGLSGDVVVPNGGDAAVVRIKRHEERTADRPERGIAIAVDCASLYGIRDSYLAAVHSVAEGMRNLAATGAYPICAAQCFNYGNPNDHKDVSEFSEATRGLSDACRVWDIPLVSDSISLYNKSDANNFLGAPVAALVGLVSDVKNACSIDFKNKGDRILLLGQTRNEVGCTEYLHYYHKRIAGMLPDINFTTEKQASELVCELIQRRLLKSAHDCSIGGLAITLTECCVSRERPIGAKLTLEPLEDRGQPLPHEAYLFAETTGRFLVTCSREDEDEVRAVCAEFEIPVTGSGEVGGKQIKVDGVINAHVPVKTAGRIWSDALNYALGIAED